MLELRVERQAYQPGETVRGWVRATRPIDGRSLEAFLEYVEETRHFREAAEGVRSGPLHQGNLPPDRWFEFALLLPPDAKPAYATEHARLWWEVHAKLDRFGRDEHARLPLTVSGVAPPHEPQPAAAPAPGWYADPSGQHRLRWWDGARWTDQVA